MRESLYALPFKTLSRNPVVTSLYDEEEGWRPTHIRLADEADLILVAPATANTLTSWLWAKMMPWPYCFGGELAAKMLWPGLERQDVEHPATGECGVAKDRGAQFIGRPRRLAAATKASADSRRKF